MIPFAISSYSMCRSVTGRFLYITYPFPLLDVDDVEQPIAKCAVKIPILDRVPSGILSRTNELWQSKGPGEYFRNAY